MVTKNGSGRTSAPQQPPAGRQSSTGPASTPHPAPTAADVSTAGDLDRLLDLIEDAGNRVRSSVSIFENDYDCLTSASFGAYYLLEDVVPMLTEAVDVARAMKRGDAAAPVSRACAEDPPTTGAAEQPDDLFDASGALEQCRVLFEHLADLTEGEGQVLATIGLGIAGAAERRADHA